MLDIFSFDQFLLNNLHCTNKSKLSVSRQIHIPILPLPKPFPNLKIPFCQRFSFWSVQLFITMELPVQIKSNGAADHLVAKDF